MTWTPPEVAKSTQNNGWVPPEVEKESAPLTDETTKTEAPTPVDEQDMKDYFSEVITPKTPLQSVSEGLAKVEKPLEKKYTEYATKKVKELTGGLEIPNPLTAPDPETFKADMANYERVLRENPMATKDNEKITAIGQLIQKSKETDTVLKDYESNTIAGNLGTGVKAGLEEYGRGYFEMAKNLDTNSAIKDLDAKFTVNDKNEIELKEGEILDQGDILLLQAVEENNKKLKQLEALDPTAFNIGKGTGQSLGFTGEFLLTGGMGAGVAKGITAGVTKAIAEGAAVSAAKRIGVGLSAKLAQTAIQVAGMPTFYKSIAEDVSQGKNFGESLFKNYYNTFAENFTERIFLKNPWNKSTVGAVDNFMGRLGVNMHTDKGLVGILASTGEEVLEEKIGEIMQAPLNYDNFNTFWKDFWDVKKNAELIGSVALMVAPMGIVSYSAKKWDDVQLNKVGKQTPGEIRSQLDEVLNDQKLSLKEQYDLVGRIVQDHANNQNLGENPAETAGNIIRYTEGKTRQAVVSAVEDRAKTPTIGDMEEITTEDQAKVDYLEGQGVKIPDGTSMTKVNEMYDAEKAKNVPETIETLDAKIAAAQKKLNLPAAPELTVSEDAQQTLDKLDNNEPVTNEFINKASDELYAKYKELEAMKKADTRRFTTEQINDAQGFLEEEITKLENFKAKQAEEGRFVSELLSSPENISPETQTEVLQKENISEPAQEKVSDIQIQKSETQPTVIQETEKSLQNEKVISENKEVSSPNNEQLTQREEAKIAERSGIKPKNLRDVYNAGRGVFGLNRVQSLAQAIVVDRVVGQISKRSGRTKQEVYSDMEFKKSNLDELSNRGKILYQAVGENAQLGFWARRGLDTAKKMDANSKDARKIKLATGWEKGADGKWRYEIPDNTKFTETWDNLGKSVQSTLSDALDAPDLFKAYPELRDVKIKKESPWLDFWQGTQGWFNPEKNELVITPYAKDPLGTAVHEIQHWIQQKEGFAKGGNTESAIENLSDLELKEISKKVIEKKNKQIEEDSKKLNEKKSLTDGMTDTDMLWISDMADEYTELRKEQDRLYDEIKNNNPGINPYSNPEMKKISDKKHEINKSFRKRFPHLTISQITDILFSKSVGVDKEIAKLEESIFKSTQDLNKLKTATDKAQIIEILKKEGGDYAFDAYRRLSGETEARNMSKRIKMTPSERKNSLLSDTEDVARDEQIILFQGEKGATEFKDSATIIHALSDPNVSTPIHEIAHVYEKYMDEAERKTVLKWAKTAEWTTETSEKFARGFERYLAEGVSPVPELKRVFEKFKEWLTDIYNGIKGSEIDLKLNKPMKDLYDQMLGKESKTTQNEAQQEVRGQETAGKEVVPEEKKIKEAAIKVADTLRKAKFIQSMDDLSKLSSDPTALLKVAWDGSVEAAAKAIELGGSVAQAVADGVKTLKESDWYKKLSDESKKIAEERFAKDIEDHLKEQNYATETGDITENGVGKHTDGNGTRKESKTGSSDSTGSSETKSKKETELKSGEVKIGHFATRMTLDETDLPKETKQRIQDEGVGEYTSLSDKESIAIAKNIAVNNSYTDIKEMVFSSSVHPSVRVNLMIEAFNKSNAEILLAEKEGRTEDLQRWADEQVNFARDFDEKVSRNSAYLLRGLGTEAALEKFAPYSHVRDYERATQERRTKLQNTKTHRDSLEKTKKAAKKARKDAIDGAVNSKEVDKIINDIKNKPENPSVSPDRLQILKNREKAAIEKLKKSFKVATSGGINSEAIEAIGELAAVYLEEFAYATSKAAKKLVKTLDKIGYKTTEEEVLKYFPEKIGDKTVKELQTEQETERAAQRLANEIFGEVIDKKPVNDPLTQMVNTLLGKFRERDLNTKEKTKKTDLQKISEAIADKWKYSDVWREAVDAALKMIADNKNMSDAEKAIAYTRVEDAYSNATSFTFTEAQVDRAIKKKMRELDIQIKDVIKEFLDIQNAQRSKLKDALIQESGLNEQDAQILADAVAKRFDLLMSESKKKIIDKYVGKINEPKTKQKKVDVSLRRVAVGDLIELINMGAFDSKEFREAYATAVGIPQVSEEHAKEIKRLATEIQRQKEPIMQHKKIQDLLRYERLIMGHSFSDLMTSVWYANVLSGLKTQERNFVGGSSGVTLRLLSDLIVSGRPGAALSGIRRGIKFGSQKAKDVLKTGYAPFSERVEMPTTAEIVSIETPGFRWGWGKIKYVGRIMNSIDLLNAEIGKEAFANILANEALMVSRKKSLFSSKYRKEVRQMVDEYLHTDKETIDRLKREIEDDALEFGYTEIEKKVILIDKINQLRPAEVEEQSGRFGVYSTGNVKSYGTIGFISETLANVFKNAGITVTINKKTGETRKIAPLLLFAAFTKISGNVGEQALNFIPFVGLYRIKQGGYGSFYNVASGKGINNKFYLELTPRERKTILGMQILGTVAMAALYALSDPGDDDDPIIRITANGTGDYNKNKSLKDWKEYSIGIKTGNGTRVWIPYKYTPLILALSVIGFVRDAKAFKDEYKDWNDLELFAMGLTSLPSFLADMTAIQSMSQALDGFLVSAKDLSNYSKVTQSVGRTIEGFYSPAIYKDVSQIYEQCWNIGVEQKIKGNSLVSINAMKQQFIGRHPISIVKRTLAEGDERLEQLDVYGRPVPIKGFWEEVLSTSNLSEEDQLIKKSQSLIGVPEEPNIKTTKFQNYSNGGFEPIILDQGNERERLLWHKYIRLRGEYIRNAIVSTRDLTGEEYIEEMKRYIEDANKVAKEEMELELIDNPIRR